VSTLLGPGAAPVQRIVATKPSELDKYLSTGDVLKGAFGKSSEPKKAFVAIRRALSEYRSEADKGDADLEMQSQRLEVLDILCTRFLAENAQDKKRRPIIHRLLDEVGMERSAVSKLQGQGIYQENIKSSKRPVAAGETDPGKKFGFQALTEMGRRGAMDHSVSMARDRAEKIKEAKGKYGITDAEVSAISIFSAGDFNYINPATANSDSWLASQKAKSKDIKDVDDKTLKQEGSLHTAVAMQGLAKMEAFKGETYRGARFTPDEFSDKFSIGKTSSFTSLASSSSDKDIALNFAHGLSSGPVPDATKSVAVLTILTDSGGVDISNIALIRSEREVLILPGSVFEVVSVEEVDGKTEYAGKVAQATGRGVPLPTKWYVAHLSPSKQADTRDRKPKAPWKSAAATGPQLPLSTPIDEYLSKAGKPARGTVGGHR
jgi:hypothetical protein